jgi:hypothetical protein
LSGDTRGTPDWYDVYPVVGLQWLIALVVFNHGCGGRGMSGRFRHDQLIGEASAVRQLLLDTLDRKCPKLVERGRAIARATTSTGTAINWPNRPARRVRSGQ